MRIVVTGGAGFIGGHYVRTLATGGYPAFAGSKITVVDSLTYAASMANLQPVLGHEDVEFVRGDICDAGLMLDVLAGSDVLVHFAAESHVDRSIKDGSAFVRTNVLGTHTLISAALQRGVARVVAVSTDEVYGSIVRGSWRETEPLLPNSPYAASKASADLIARSYMRTHGLDVSITRGSNTYGPFQFPEKLIPLFVSNLLDGEEVPLYGNGSNLREWLHVSDHCSGIQLVAERGMAGEVYNIGGGTEMTNLELTYELLARLDKDRAMIRWVDDRKGHDYRYSVDWSKIREELGYSPKVSLAVGLDEVVAWHRENRGWWEPLKQRSRSGQG